MTSKKNTDENEKLEDTQTAEAQRKFRNVGPKKKINLIIFIVIPLLLILVGAVPMLDQQYQGFVIRSIFFLTICLFPATMYYLFISTRKYSLLNEYSANLNRLGLLEKKKNESEIAWNRRLDTYFQKFHGVYGILPKRESDLKINEGEIKFNPKETEFFAPETTVPVVFAIILIATGWIIILPPWNPNSISLSVLGAFFPDRTPVNFAFLGSYFFSIQMLFRRYVRRDMRTSAFVAISLRIILAIIGIWAVEILLEGQLNNDQLTVIGFVIGVFPQTAWQFVQAIVKRISGFIIPSFKTPLPLRGLDGLTVWNEARLEEEDIENIPNMATADIADLMLTTRISPDRIIDWIDQAILYTYLGDVEENNSNREQRTKLPEKRWKLRSYGIRTATSLIEVCRDGCNIQLDQETLEIVHSLEKAIKTNTNIELIQKWKAI